MGGGCGISVNGRFRVGTERTMLAMPETALGFFPDVGGSYFLSKLKDNLGLYLGLTGYRLHGADAYHAGLATHYVFTMEYRLSQRFFEDHDIYEGCRAILIDKDRKSKWKPEKLEDVTDAVMERYFAPLGQHDLILGSQ
ncbi:hypothetical protein KIN20_016614 [Parelaphostrongylus tenuis]|uniref:3-hydroxyisobutyryl-CoA hydrolase, mitochondrial n=1 Tax=Parelaphostrongylus tenuis TaxID=148309 RepID=A0AAD5MHL4_PARTN|nr:hypothetical protein KIN20_016614 [Parelaphostrongylus tenuis]